jgi:hypothetical protein
MRGHDQHDPESDESARYAGDGAQRSDGRISWRGSEGPVAHLERPTWYAVRV